MEPSGNKPAALRAPGFVERPQKPQKKPMLPANIVGIGNIISMAPNVGANPRPPLKPRRAELQCPMTVRATPMLIIHHTEAYWASSKSFGSATTVNMPLILSRNITNIPRGNPRMSNISPGLIVDLVPGCIIVESLHSLATMAPVGKLPTRYAARKKNKYCDIVI